MISCENKVFNQIATQLRSQYSGIVVYGEYVNVPSSFPCVTLIEEENTVYEKTRSTKENHSKVMFEINVYSNLANGKKAEAKTIANFIDTKMADMGFNRDFFGQTPNQDSTIYRITLRYTGIVEKQTSGGNSTYYIAKR